MIDCIAIIDNKQISTNSKDFQSVTFDSISAVICCLPELLVCLPLASVWITGIEYFAGFHSILTKILGQPRDSITISK